MLDWGRTRVCPAAVSAHRCGRDGDVTLADRWLMAPRAGNLLENGQGEVQAMMGADAGDADSALAGGSCP
jgi:hypothetical protein